MWAYLELTCFFSRLRRRPKARARASDPLRVLLISPFPPDTHGGVYRPASLAKYAAPNGVELQVLTNANITGAHPAGLALLAELGESANVNVFTPHRQPSWRFFPNIDGGFVTAIGFAKHARLALRAFRPDVVLCSGPPFCFFVAGYWLSFLWGAKLALDYRDEWGQNPFEFARKSAFDSWWEGRCQRAAELIVFTTESQKDLNDQLFAEHLNGKTVVVQNGWDESHLVVHIAEAIPSERKDFVEIAFAGNLAEHTLPGSFLQAMTALDKHRVPPLRLTFIGRRQKKAIQELEAVRIPAELVYEDQIPTFEVIGRLNQAGVALIIASAGLCRYIPGKLYYYLASRTPILVYGDPGEVSRIVESLDAGRFVATGDYEGLAKFLNDAFKELGRWDTEERRQWVARHTRQRGAVRLFDFLKQL